MDRDDKGNSVILFGQNPAKVSVPSVTMDEVGVDVCRIEIDTPPHGAESGAQRFWTGEITRVEFKADYFEVAFIKTLVAKASHFHRHHLGQFAREIAHMHTGATVDVRRILVSEKENLHAALLRAHKRNGTQIHHIPLARPFGFSKEPIANAEKTL